MYHYNRKITRTFRKLGIFFFLVLLIVKKYKDTICKTKTKSRIANDGSDVIGLPHAYVEYLLL